MRTNYLDKLYIAVHPHGKGPSIHYIAKHYLWTLNYWKMLMARALLSLTELFTQFSSEYTLYNFGKFSIMQVFILLTKASIWLTVAISIVIFGHLQGLSQKIAMQTILRLEIIQGISRSSFTSLQSIQGKIGKVQKPGVIDKVAKEGLFLSIDSVDFLQYKLIRISLFRTSWNKIEEII